MSRHERRDIIDRGHSELSVVRQCELLDISRSSVYYNPVEASEYELGLMELIDRQYLQTPFYGSRKMTACLRRQGHQVNRKRVQRLMRRMGIEAIYRRPNTSRRDSGHKVYPYLLRGLQIDKVNQVWATDITYIPTWAGFLYLAVVVDAFSRRIVGWSMANNLKTQVVVDAMNIALAQRRPTIIIRHSDQGTQYTSVAFGLRCKEAQVRLSMGSVGDAGACPRA